MYFIKQNELSIINYNLCVFGRVETCMGYSIIIYKNVSKLYYYLFCIQCNHIGTITYSVIIYIMLFYNSFSLNCE